MFRFSTSLKMASGYLLLLLLLVGAVGYICHEMEEMAGTDGEELLLSRNRRATYRVASRLYQLEMASQPLSLGLLEEYPRYVMAARQTDIAIDSLRLLLSDSIQLARLDTVEMLLARKKRNIADLLQLMQVASPDQAYRQKIENLVAQKDSLAAIPHVRRTTVTQTQSYSAPQKKKGFFRRLREVFVPAKGDSARISRMTKEEVVDTLSEDYSAADTVAALLTHVQQQVADTRRQQQRLLNERTQALLLNGLEINRKVNEVLGTIENEDRAMARRQYLQREEIRRSSAQTVAYIAIVAVILAVSFLTLVWRDIRRSNRYRHELERAKQRAEDLLAVREKLMITITHDIKAPVSSILGYTDLLSQMPGDARQKACLDNMQSSATHLLDMVNSLLDYHRLDARKMEVEHVPFQPASLFDLIADSFRPLADAKGLLLRYTCQIDPDRKAAGDPFRIRQIVENLLSNALKFTQNGEIVLQVWTEGERCCFSVTDTGCGIAPDEQEKLFHEFTRLSGAQGKEGFGLGLAITRKLVQLLGGEIRVESTLGKGSCFTVSFPLDAASVVEEQRQATPALTLPPLQLLLIDDDRIQLELTSAMLTAAGLIVTGCCRPEELLEYLQKHSYDLILTDIQMPAMDGFTLLKAIRELPVHWAACIPVLALTARSDMDAEVLKAGGFAGCVHKPFKAAELQAEIGRICVGDGSLLEQESSSEEPSLADTGDGCLHFEALTAFSGGDPEAAADILRTFVRETERSYHRLDQALQERNLAEASAVAHKLLPLFLTLGASRCVPALTWLEELHGEGTFSTEVVDRIKVILDDMSRIIREAKSLCGV